MSITVPLELDRDRLLGAVAPLPEPTERPLRLAETHKPVRKSPLVGALVSVGIVLGILAAQLGLSIAISQGAYEVRALEIEKRDLSRVQRLLSQNVDKLASPQNLAANAAAQGMVQNVQPATLQLSTGAILGSMDSKTTEANSNLVPNATLSTLPTVDAQGVSVSRNTGLPAATTAKSTDAPVRWKGKLPAPDTH
ncbi:hypothetical protein G7066_06065 [Leucobacter coleopterorum]|uniref:Cell division protein FtsL n=1 Tax=Leucobacter coleopterorum TaxID=2714933 RepID=A0ABX6JVI5_9MICO|nr:hypothetical protein [Leucobacter coleopterorum]QIM18321.1 hypothetical protein G7066_06065 [Leucobacter coleopterorum]